MALESDPLDWPWKPNHSPSPEELQKWRVTVVFQALRKLMSSFHLPPPRITLREILKESREREALNDLLTEAQRLSGVDIRPALESALLTIPLLPKRYRRASRSQRRQARNLPTRIRKWADELEKTLPVEGDRSQAALDKGRSLVASFKDFVQLPNKLRQYADFLDEKSSHTRLVSYGSRNPQLRAADLLSAFFRTATGRFQDSRLAVLLASAFIASGKEPPNWIDRLTLERTRQSKRLKRLLQMAFPSKVSPR